MHKPYESALLPFQWEGIERIKSFGYKALLSDLMGMGKTIQVIAACDIAGFEKILIVCPATLKLNWQNEIRKWVGEDEKILICESRTSPKFITMAHENYRWYICNYDIILDWQGWFDLFVKPDIKIADEAHLIKNDYDNIRAGKDYRINYRADTAYYGTGRAMGFDRLRADRCIAITGTPLLESRNDLANLLRIVNFDITFDKEVFNNCSYELLNRKLKEKVMIRRLKEDVLKDLPEKERKIIRVHVEGNMPLGKTRAEKEYFNTTVAKWAEIDKFIKGYLARKEKLVVFCRWQDTSYHLSGIYSNAVLYNGNKTQEQKQNAVDKFMNDPDCLLFIGTIGTASVGITLTAACDTLTIELSDNPAVHLQAEDRVHRVSQKAKKCTNYYIISDDDMELKTMQRLDKKMKEMKEVVDGQEITESDVFMGNFLTLGEKNDIRKSRKEDNMDLFDNEIKRRDLKPSSNEESNWLGELLFIAAGIPFYLFYWFVVLP